MEIAILGYGVVASGAYEVLEKSGYTVKKILDIRPHPELGNVLTSDFEDILKDDEIKIVAEAIGGLEPAHTFAVKALSAGKHFVSSNKHLICTYYDELHSLAKKNGVTLRYTSSAGGGIPWLYNLKRTVRCDDVYKISGIMNGTTNFILDAMISDGREFEDVLREAQSLGYAEANPSADIDGLDTARKTAISSSIAFNTVVKENDVAVFSMRNIKKCDVDYIVNKLGKTVRYFGCGIRSGDVVSAFTEPVLLDKGALEANVSKNFNMISLFSDSVGKLSFYGQGAGKYPTGNALAQDIMDIANGDLSFDYAPEAKETDNGACKRKYYIRTAADIKSDIFDSEELYDGVRYIMTKETTILYIHALAEKIYALCPDSFFAGIE